MGIKLSSPEFTFKFSLLSGLRSNSIHKEGFIKNKIEEINIRIIFDNEIRPNLNIFYNLVSNSI